ncbi:unnamed protein product [Amoebophrya sp. A120]|nr:unnamed protein product [Amoebophrya sp. A120]|eukprot:GSA120T00015598001.1
MSVKEAIESEKNGGKIFIGNIQKDVREEDVEDVMKKYGEVLSVWVAQNPPGFAFCTFRDPADAKAAIKEAHGLQVDFAVDNGKGLRCEISSYAQRRHNPRRGDSRDRRGGGRGRDRSRSRGRGRGRGRDSRSRGRDRDRERRRRDSRSRGRGRGGDRGGGSDNYHRGGRY